MSVETQRGRSATSNDDQSLLVRVDDLHLYFETKRGEVKALEGVNFDIYDGEFMALVGETGCGKTVTGRSFVQLVPTPPGWYPAGGILMRSERVCPDCGGVGCDECFDTGREFENLLELSTEQITQYRGERIAMIFQDPQTALNPSLTIQEQIAEAILSHQADEVFEDAGVDITSVNPLFRPLLRNEVSMYRSFFESLVASVSPVRRQRQAIRTVIRERVVDVLEDVQIPNPREVLTNYPHELSGGQQQRIVIAIALVAKPELIIADEATTALDVTTQARILSLVQELQADYGTSLLYITHDLNLVREIADRVAVMYAGSIAEISDVENVYSNPLHPYTVGLINSIPRPDLRGHKLEGIPGSVPNLITPPSGCRFCPRCPEVMDHCCDEEPPYVEEDAGHFVRCHLYPSDERDEPTVVDSQTS